MNGEFVISLDYELFWGVFDSKTVEDYGKSIERVHDVFPKILDLFEKYEIRTTIAFVGLLMCERSAHAMELVPQAMLQKPGIPSLLKHHLIEMRASKVNSALYFDKGIVERLKDNERHELASHTFCHYYCQEPYSEAEDLKGDLHAFNTLCADLGIRPKTIIFPRNQFAEEHLKVCENIGYTVYRGNPEAYYHRKGNGVSTNLLTKGVRLLDSYVPLSGDMTSDIKREGAIGIINVPASLFLRPVTSANSLLAKLQLRRIKRCMRKAAMEKKRFHLWWHPHNFGKDPEANLHVLEEILMYYSILKSRYDFENKTMAQSAGIAK